MKRKATTPTKPSTSNKPSTSTRDQSTQSESSSTERSSNNDSNPSVSRQRKQPMPKKKKPARVKYIIEGVPHSLTKKLLKDEHRLQSDPGFLIPRLPFARVVKEICMEFADDNLRIQKEALEALQTSAEMYISNFFEDSTMCSLHAKRVTLYPKDMRLVQKITKQD